MPSSSPKIALITGGSRGIGRAIVIGLARAGWTTAFSYHRSAEAAQAVLAELEALGQPGLAAPGDVANAADRERLVNTVLEEYGGIDLLINNAGMAPVQRTDLLEMSEPSYNEVMDTNLKGPFFLTQRVARQMVEQVRSGDAEIPPAIINIGSVSAYAASANRGEYCLSKAGLSMLTVLFAERLAAYGIRVYEVRAGIIATDMTATVHEKYDKLISEGLLPLARWGTPEDVARAVVTLAGGALPYSTGEIINVDGGFHLRRL